MLIKPSVKQTPLSVLWVSAAIRLCDPFAPAVPAGLAASAPPGGQTCWEGLCFYIKSLFSSTLQEKYKAESFVGTKGVAGIPVAREKMLIELDQRELLGMFDASHHTPA